MGKEKDDNEPPLRDERKSSDWQERGKKEKINRQREKVN